MTDDAATLAPVARKGLPTRYHWYLLTVAGMIETLRRTGSPRLVEGTARALAALAYRLSRDKRQRTERHVTEAFGPRAPRELARVVRGSFFTFWDETLAFAAVRNAKPPEIVGLEHLEAARAAGRGAILWESGSFGRRNLAKQALARSGFAVHQVHDRTHRAGFGGDSQPSWLRDRVVLPYFTARERTFVADVVLLSRATSIAGVRTIQRLLRGNAIVCITADVPLGERLLTVPLLGRAKRFATGMVTLARASGAALLPLFCVREDDGRCRVIVEPPVPVPTSSDRDAVLESTIRTYAARLESYLRRYPDQYRSWHFPWWSSQ